MDTVHGSPGQPGSTASPRPPPSWHHVFWALAWAVRSRTPTSRSRQVKTLRLDLSTRPLDIVSSGLARAAHRCERPESRSSRRVEIPHLGTRPVDTKFSGQSRGQLTVVSGPNQGQAELRVLTSPPSGDMRLLGSPWQFPVEAILLLSGPNQDQIDGPPVEADVAFWARPVDREGPVRFNFARDERRSHYTAVPPRTLHHFAEAAALSAFTSVQDGRVAGIVHQVAPFRRITSEGCPRSRPVAYERRWGAG